MRAFLLSACFKIQKYAIRAGMFFFWGGKACGKFRRFWMDNPRIRTPMVQISLIMIFLMVFVAPMAGVENTSIRAALDTLGAVNVCFIYCWTIGFWPHWKNLFLKWLEPWKEVEVGRLQILERQRLKVLVPTTTIIRQKSRL